jgi:hypothetical protein
MLAIKYTTYQLSKMQLHNSPGWELNMVPAYSPVVTVTTLTMPKGMWSFHTPETFPLLTTWCHNPQQQKQNNKKYISIQFSYQDRHQDEVKSSG